MIAFSHLLYFHLQNITGYREIIEEMGQKCCSASQNAPQIHIQQEETAIGKTHQSVPHPSLGPNSHGKEQIDKRTFYGKNGDVHSRTFTKDMAATIDSSFDQYKMNIFKQASTIREETEESYDSPLESNYYHKTQSSHCTEVYDNYLQNLAEDVSSKP